MAGPFRHVGTILLRWCLPYCLGGLGLGLAIGLIPRELSESPGLFVRWILPVAGAAAGLASGLCWSVTVATERITDAIAGFLTERLPAAGREGGVQAALTGALGDQLRRRVAGTLRLLRLIALLLLGLVATAAALTVLLAP